MANFFTDLKRCNLYRVAAICAVVAGCAAQSSKLPYYQLPSSGGASIASVKVATIEGSFQTPEGYRGVCAYVFAVDGRRVGDRVNCTAAIPILPGKHTVVAWLEG